MANRADRRKARGSATGASPLDALRQRIVSAALPGTPPKVADRARHLLGVFLDSAERDGRSPAWVQSALTSGEAAALLGGMAREAALQAPPPEVRNAACAAGCAWCCILDGPDGGTITEHEARRVHESLSSLAGQPDGREWHPAACPALDPATRLCRAYDSRPSLCRSFVSTDASACEENAKGGEAAGAGLLVSHLDYLALHALARAAFGAKRVATYALNEVAAAAVEGLDEDAALTAARHGDKVLADVRRGTGRAFRIAGR